MSKCVILLVIFIVHTVICSVKEPAPECLQPIDKGTCRAEFPSYGYNSSTKTCELFYYGGCKGNSNRFDTQLACEEACNVH